LTQCLLYTQCLSMMHTECFIIGLHWRVNNKGIACYETVEISTKCDTVPGKVLRLNIGRVLGQLCSVGHLVALWIPIWVRDLWKLTTKHFLAPKLRTFMNIGPGPLASADIWRTWTRNVLKKHRAQFRCGLTELYVFPISSRCSRNECLPRKDVLSYCSTVD
jgi:hypothetical protein